MAPYYYHRQKEDGGFSDGSACGNEMASERKMCRQLILHSVKYWAEEYGLDGFRFDLMGLHDTETMNLIRKEDFKDLTEYYRGLIALRGEIGLYMIQTPQFPSRVEVTKAKDRVVVIRMDNRNTGKTERWQELFIVCNSGKRSVQEKLPEGKWEKLVDKSSSWHWKKQSIWSRMKKAGGSAGVTGSTIVIYGRKEG